MAQALVQCGWLHHSEKGDRQCVTGAIGALVLRALQAGVTPSQKPLLEIDAEAVQAAWPWAKPGSQPTAQNVALALKNAVKCAQIVGFGPEVFAAKMRQMLEQRSH
jgi:hypothetical protein